VKDTYREAFRAFNIGSLLIANDQGVTFIGQKRKFNFQNSQIFYAMNKKLIKLFGSYLSPISVPLQR
jgi:hypothetical protein